MLKRIVTLAAVAALMTASLSLSAQDTDADVNPDLVNANNAFAFDLYGQLQSNEGNLFFSPYSVSQALAMTYAGAEGATAAQMADVLHFADVSDLHPAFATLNTSLTGREYTGFPFEDETQAGSTFTLNIANALWGQQGYPFAAEYTNLIDENYGGGFREVDFANNADAVREEINNWVAEQTEDRIQDIVPEGLPDPMTRLAIANAIYFNASWMNQFNEAQTADAPFFLLDGSEVTVPMMQQTESLSYAADEGYQAVALPYFGGDYAMLVILPDEGTFSDFEAELTAEHFAEIQDSLRFSGDIRLFMPRFEYEYSLNLSDVLQAMGMNAPFSPSEANFNGMLSEPTDENVYIGAVLHKAFVAVDEEGTEAAAATVIMMEATAALPNEPTELRLDRPFIYAIQDNVTGSVLFLGRVMNPAG